MITILHTFGRDLKFHPHLHVIAAESYFFKDRFVPSKISFDCKFNKKWRSIVLNNFELNFNNYKYGFYIWCSKNSLSKPLTKYIGRYVRHPVIANGRIIRYNKNKITFFYKDNQNNRITLTKTINNFITSLIQHIPPEQFKMIRYYGIYSRNQRRKISPNRLKT